MSAAITGKPRRAWGCPGTAKFASNKADLQSTGYGKNMGSNVIEYDQSAAFNRSESTVVDVSRADRGSES
jgi:hypothetical protein